MPTIRNANRIDYTRDGWRDLISHLGSAKDTGAGLRMSWSTFRGNINAWKFSNAANSANGLHVAYHVDHDYKPGSLGYIHVHCAPAASASTGTIAWKFDYTLSKGHSQAAFQPAQTVALSATASPTQYQHMIIEDTVGIDLLEPDTLVQGFVYRDGAAGTCPDDFFALYCDFHYQTDRTSTNQKAPPWDT